MNRFDDVTTEQFDMLEQLVECSRRNGNETYHVHTSQTGGWLSLSDTGIKIVEVPGERVFYTGLHDLGFISANYDNGTSITLQQKSFEFVDYMHLPKRRRRWEDFKFDLDHDASFRSKLLWLLVTVGIGYLGQFLLGLIGIHL